MGHAGLHRRVLVECLLVLVGGGSRSNTTRFTVPVNAYGARSS